MPLPKRKTTKPAQAARTQTRAKSGPQTPQTVSTRGTKRKAVDHEAKAAKVQRTSRTKRVGANNAALLPGDGVGVGNSDFKELVKSGFTIVDKSMLIAEFIDTKDKVSLILRPRRFGKTTNLTMLRLFFELIDDENEREHEKRRALFAEMEIANKRPELLGSAFGKYPVIYLSLKDISGRTWDEMLTYIHAAISKIYKEHRYLREHLQQDEVTKFDRIISEDPTFPALACALQDLSEYLARYHQQKCVVLIDEYDAPIGTAYHKGYCDDAMEFLRPMFSLLLKDNVNLHQAFLVGILRVSKSGFLSGLNNISVYPMTDPRFARSFGFTEDEVKLLLAHHDVKIPMADVVYWYNGYHAGKKDHRYSLFNPWSIICLCRDQDLQPFWNESGGTTTIKKLLLDASQDFKDAVSTLLDRKPVNHILYDNMSYGDLTLHDDQALWAFLYYSGYLTIDNDKVSIPNSEVYMQWVDWIVPRLANPMVVADLLDLLVAGDIDKFKTEFEKTMLECLSFHDVGGSKSGKKAEVFYHAFCLGLFVALRRRGYNLTSNREAGVGRYDIRAEPPLPGTLPAIVMELKVVNKGDVLETRAQEALNQIFEKQYCVGSLGEVKTILLFGIAFEGKKAFVVTDAINRD